MSQTQKRQKRFWKSCLKTEVRAPHQKVLARSSLWSSKLHGKEIEEVRLRGSGPYMSEAAVSPQIDQEHNTEKREICLCGVFIFLVKRSVRKHASLETLKKHNFARR